MSRRHIQPRALTRATAGLIVGAIASLVAGLLTEVIPVPLAFIIAGVFTGLACRLILRRRSDIACRSEPSPPTSLARWTDRQGLEFSTRTSTVKHLRAW
jgi:uncharacterized RDD family membrane protein YckC